MSSKLLLVIAMGFLFLFACTRDKSNQSEIACGQGIETTYTNNVKDIIDSSCAYSGCHDGSDINIGDYRFYDGLIPALENGILWREVFELSDMPVPGTIGDEMFGQAESALVQCWIENGFPE